MQYFANINDWWQKEGSMRPLYEYNIVRVQFMREIIEQQIEGINSEKPFQNLKILDVGCGGGLLSESLCRLGGNVLGIDACENSILQAKNHQKKDKFLTNLQYQHTSLEDLIENNSGNQFDMITSMEVIEHVNNKKQFIECISKLLKKDSLLFMSTMEKSLLSLLTVKFSAEYLLRVVPIGTHQWDKFIDPKDLQSILQEFGLENLKIQGVFYDPLQEKMVKTNNKIQYMVAAIKK